RYPRGRGADIPDGLAVRGGVTGENLQRETPVGAWINREQAFSARRGQPSSRLEHDRGRARDVPERGTVVMHERQRSQRDVAKVERRRSDAAEPVAPHPAFYPRRHALGPRRPDGEKRAGGERGRRDFHEPSVAPCPVALGGLEELIAQ